MVDSNLDRSAAVAQFCELTGIGPSEAEPYLASSGWDVAIAAQTYFDEIADADDAGTETSFNPRDDATHPVDAHPPLAQDAPTRNTHSQQPKKKFASLRDFEGDNGGGGHGSGDEDSDRGQEFYTGGDKSGLAVHDPADNNSRNHNMVQKLIDTAKRSGRSRSQQEETEGPQQSSFTGPGQTLGGDDVPSRTVSDPSQPSRSRSTVERTLHLWADGYSVDDGQLYRYDDPANEATLEMINRGAAPLELMNVEPGQDVDVKLIQHRGQNYVAPKPKYKAFSGGGQRLGSPTPGMSSNARSEANSAPSSATNTTGSSALAAASVEVDESKPLLTLQIRLGDGTQLRPRFNSSHTIADVYSFVDRANLASTQRDYALMTTFPTKELSNRALVLGDIPELKRGGVVVQKWK